MKNKMYLLSILAFILLVGFSVLLILVNVSYPVKYKKYVNQYSKMYNVDEALVYAIIKQESDFNSTAVSNAGAIGLMQILPSTAKWYSQIINEEYRYEKLFEPEFNIKIGVAYFAYLNNKFEDAMIALCAYNAGEGVVEKWINSLSFSLETIPYIETKNYVKKVQKNYEKYKTVIS